MPEKTKTKNAWCFFKESLMRELNTRHWNKLITVAVESEKKQKGKPSNYR